MNFTQFKKEDNSTKHSLIILTLKHSQHQRLCSLTKPVITKNTTRLRTNTFGFYAIKGQSTINFKDNSKKEDIIEFLKLIRAINPYGRIMIILDNFQSHHANLTTSTAAKLNIDLIFLPPYSPHLNPIEFIWKTIKRQLSPLFTETKEQLKKYNRKTLQKILKIINIRQQMDKKISKKSIKK